MSDQVHLSGTSESAMIAPEGDKKIESVVSTAQDRAYVRLDLKCQGEIELKHVPDKVRSAVQELERRYHSIFSTTERKVGVFNGFVASIPLTNYTPHRDVKRNFSSQVIDEIRPTIQSLLREGA